MHAGLVEWGVFAAILLSLLAFDLWGQRNDHGTSKKEAAFWSIIWVGVGLLFSVFVYYRMGDTARDEYLAAYLIEKALSVDNLFVFLLIFTAMKIPLKFQRTALEWGIFGALIFRAIFIELGAEALQRYSAVGIIFALLLFYAGVQSLFAKPEEEDSHEESKLVKFLCKYLPVSGHQEKAHFFVKEDGRLKVSPLLVTIFALECTDILFAVDSVPAALSFSKEVFIVYSSNAFAILGLRALYVLLAGLIADLKYLHYGLAFVLVFAGLKMIGHSCEVIAEHVAAGTATKFDMLCNGGCNYTPWMRFFSDIAPLNSVFIILGVVGLAAIMSLVIKDKPKANI